MAQGAIGTGFTAIRVGKNAQGDTTNTAVSLIERGTITVSPAAVSANSTADTSLSIADAALGDTVILNPQATALQAGLVVCQAWVSAAGTVKVRILNSTAGSMTPTSGTWNYLLIRS